MGGSSYIHHHDGEGETKGLCVCAVVVCVCVREQREWNVWKQVLHHKMEGVAKHYEGGVYERGRSSLDLSSNEIYIDYR